MVRDDVVQGGRFHDQRKAAAAEFTRVASRNRALSDLYHDPIHLRLLKIWSSEPVMDIESIHAEKQNIRAQATQRFFCNWAYQRKGILANGSAGENDFQG